MHKHYVMGLELRLHVRRRVADFGGMSDDNVVMLIDRLQHSAATDPRLEDFLLNEAPARRLLTAQSKIATYDCLCLI